MSKNKTGNKSKFVELPPVHHVDDIAVFTDEELLERVKSVETQRTDALRNCVSDLVPWETELCYLRREMQLRSQRRHLHERYLQECSVEAERARRLEEALPWADLDNSEFVYIYAEINGY